MACEQLPRQRHRKTLPTAPFLFLAFLALALATTGCRQAEEVQRPAPTPEHREPVWTVGGYVAVPRGLDASGVLVFAEGSSLIAATDQDGRWTLRGVPEGEYLFRARREDLRPAIVGTLTLSRRDPATPPSGERVNLPAAEMTAARRPETESPAVALGALRGVIRLLDGSEHYSDVLIQIAGTEIRTVTNALGEYYFPALPPGDIQLVFSRKDLQTLQTSASIQGGREMPGPIVELRPSETAAAASRALRGSIEMYDPEGVEIARQHHAIVLLEGTTHIAVPDSQGRFAFTDLPPGSYSVMATASGFELREKVEVDLTRLEAAEVVIVLDEREEVSRNLGLVSGRVVYETTSDLMDNSGILVSLVGANLVAVTDLDGFYQIANVPAGQYLFRAQAEGHIPEFIDKVMARPGEETRLPELVLFRHIEPPVVVYTEPAAGTRDVPIVRDTQLRVRFSKRMRPETVKAAFSISPPVAARLFMGREHPQSDFDLLYVELLGTPGIENAAPLRFATTYRVTIDDVAADYEDAYLEEPYWFEFSTGSPMIISTNPTQGNQFAFVSHREPLTIEFNAQMAHANFSPNDIRFQPEPSGRPTIQAYDDPISGWTALRFYTQLDLDKEYTVTLRGNWRTVDGARIGNLPYRIQFKTARFYEYQPYSGVKR